LKAAQKKYEQAVIDLKSANSKKDIVERSLKEAEGQLKLLKEKYEDSQISL
jgi:flagellar biosynthesis chaperone FliJ